MEHIARKPRTLPISAIESIRTLPTSHVVFEHAKIMLVMEGTVQVTTDAGSRRMSAGCSLALGAGARCSLSPNPAVRMWTVFVDEELLRHHVSWLLPDRSRVFPGVHPDDWDGSPLMLTPGVSLVERLESLWRQISVVDDGKSAPEVMAARSLALFAHALELSVPVFLDPGRAEINSSAPLSPVMLGALTALETNSHVAQALQMLRTRMSEQWSMHKLSDELALSRAHLTRIFSSQVGVTPMRFLVEIRLTEFTRLIEETDLSIGVAAQQVGWADSRVAAGWFRRRYRSTPSRFRHHPHVSHDQRDFSD